MTALPKEFVNASRSRRRPDRSARGINAVSLHSVNEYPRAIALDNKAAINLSPASLPTSLQFLMRFQQATTVITLGLVGLTLGLYAWTVYTPKSWSKEFHKLQTLQKYERQLVASNESIKHQLANQALTPRSGLVKIAPQQNIFLPVSVTNVQSSAAPKEADKPDLLLNRKLVSY